jgi:predicted nucleic acid-binding protein
MQTYLLDTCIWSYWWDTHAPEHDNVVHHADTLDSGSVLGISAVTFGEIEFGWQWVGSARDGLGLAYRQFVERRNPKLFEVDRHTAIEYGRLKASLCDTYMPRNERNHACRLSQLVDPVTSERLGVDENDLWIAAQAIVRDLALITNDKLMRIREIAGDRLYIENWAI